MILKNVKKWCIEFSKGKVYYNGRCLYDCNYKYFKLHLSILNGLFEIPKLCITDGSRSLVVYLTKKDIHKLINENYDIRVV